jgi:hypothetical protein
MVVVMKKASRGDADQRTFSGRITIISASRNTTCGGGETAAMT